MIEIFEAKTIEQKKTYMNMLKQLHLFQCNFYPETIQKEILNRTYNVCDLNHLSHDHKLFLISKDNIYIGIFKLSFNMNHVFLSSFYLLPEYRNNGNGKQVLNFINSFLKNNKINKIILQVLKKNINAYLFYMKNDFKHMYKVISLSYNELKDDRNYFKYEMYNNKDEIIFNENDNIVILNTKFYMYGFVTMKYTNLLSGEFENHIGDIICILNSHYGVRDVILSEKDTKLDIRNLPYSVISYGIAKKTPSACSGDELAK